MSYTGAGRSVAAGAAFELRLLRLERQCWHDLVGGELTVWNRAGSRGACEESIQVLCEDSMGFGRGG